MSVSDNKDSIDGLPKQFVSSLRILFEILDENRTGYVRLCDIESRWSDSGVRGLPSGVVEALRKVTPSDGLLSFNRFVSGLKLALLKHKSVSSHNGKENRGPGHHIHRADIPRGREAPHNQPRVQSQPPPQSNRGYPVPVTATVKPNNAGNTNYRKSFTNLHQGENIYTTAHDAYRPPPRPERPGVRKSVDPPEVPPRDRTKSGRVLSELKNWQRERSSVAQTSESREHRLPSNADKVTSSNRNDQYAIYANIEQFQRKNADEKMKVTSQSSVPSNTNQQSKPNTDGPQKPVRRQNSARRHTLSSGLDYNAIKRMKQFEEERDMLLLGIEAVDQAREWYRKQISVIQEKQKYVGKSSFNEHSLEAHQERMNFQKARIMEVNHHLKTLTESSEKGFPLHMNLAVGPSMVSHPNTVKMLKDQNRQLTQEVSQKSDKITQLEQEKSTLIRELFEARSKNKTNYDDTTFM